MILVSTVKLVYDKKLDADSEASKESFVVLNDM